MERGGRTLHCLMGVAAIGASGGTRSHLTDRCEKTLGHLLKEADVASDWDVDPILQQNCQVIIFNHYFKAPV